MLEKTKVENNAEHRNIPLLDLRALFEQNREEYVKAMVETAENCQFIGGKAVADFEAAFSEWVLDGSYCVGVGNGTDAITFAAKALNLPEGSEAIIPAMTYFATAEAIAAAGFKVKLVDVEPGTWLMDLDALEKAITKNTKLIVPVHLYGQMVAMDKLKAIAEKHDCKIIEDAAQAQGALYQNKPPAHFGNFATYSFYPGKNLGAFGDAGGIVSRDKELIEVCRAHGNHGGLGKFQHDFIAQNSRLDGIQAAVLNIRLKSLKAWNDLRQEVAKRYWKNLRDIEHIVLPKCQSDAYHVYHQFVTLVEEREPFQDYLKSRGVSTGLHYPKAIHQLGAFEKMFEGEHFLQAEKVAAQGVSLPMGPTLSMDEVDYVCQVIVDYFKMMEK